MTSVLNVDTIADKAGTGPVGLTKQYAAKAWADFDGTGTAHIDDSNNYASITDNGTGDYTFAFINSMSADSYAPSGSTEYTNLTSQSVHTKATGSIRMFHIDSSNNANDVEPASVLVHGDLA